jgi:hypothetical protein
VGPRPLRACEHPGRFALVDVDESDASAQALVRALGALGEEPELALRDGDLLVPRLARAPAEPQPEGAWHVEAGSSGTLEELALAPSLRAEAPLEAGEVRVAVRAAGLNFRDVLIALGMYPGEAPLGSEAAGVVLEVGPGVEDLAVGDRVMGLVPDALGPVGVADRRMLVRIPTAGRTWTRRRCRSRS